MEELRDHWSGQGRVVHPRDGIPLIGSIEHLHVLQLSLAGHMVFPSAKHDVWPMTLS